MDYGRTCISYKKARMEAMQRDKHKCQFPNCKRKGTVVHHIIKYASSPYLRWNVSNLITLCKKHHWQVYGKEDQYIILFSDINARNSRHKRKD